MTIYWAPIGNGGTIGCRTPSSTLEALSKGFGGRPWIMGTDCIAGLKFMQAADPRNDTYQELLDLIYKYEQIRVWAE
jgi:hypothetical protein